MRIKRLLTAAGLFAVFGVAFASRLSELRLSLEGETPPALLPAALANPAEVGFQDTLHAGETLSELLSRAQLDESEVQALLDELQELQDPRRMKPGSVISYRRSFETGDVRGMLFRIDADRTLSMERAGAAWAGSVEEVPVRVDSVVLAGTVRSSLYAALVDGQGEGVPASEREAVADQLADRIFAWQVDFSRDLRAGDSFRILYERMVRPDGTARSGRVLGVQFRIDDKDHEAYLYRAPDGTENYFARDGQSLRRAFLSAPLEFRRISSAFSTSRFHPILGRARAHLGIDYAASAGTPVRAVGSGTIRRANFSSSYGNVVEVGHARGYSTRYAHLRSFAKGIRSGVRVEQGDIIGYVGSTGLATGPHLHFEFYSGGKAVNPNSIPGINEPPLASRYKAEFLALVRRQVATLDQMSGGVRLAARATPIPASE